MKPLISLVVLLALLATSSFGNEFETAFIGDEVAFGAHNEGAYEWAKEELGATLVGPDDIPKHDLTKFAVLWWHEGDNAPGELEEAVIAAALDYLTKGGTLLISAGAEKYAFDLGIETGQFRLTGPLDDNSFAGVAVREDTKDLSIWAGFDRTPGTEIQISPGLPRTADYHKSQLVDGKTIGNCWRITNAGQQVNYGEQIGGFVEWAVGNGKVFAMGWRISYWKDGNDDRATLEKLTMNVVNYLAEASAFFAVSPEDRLPLAWGGIKSRR